MERKLVYDLPTRLFHWLFAGLFLTGFIIAKTVDDESLWFSFHSLAGLTLGFVVVLRIVWGIFGTHHARFTNFALNPIDLVSYFKGIFSGKKKRWAGHNPASSWAAIIMMLLALGLAITGYLMSAGPNKEDFEDFHELFANGFIVVVILHVAGIILHTIRYQEMIGLSMVDGQKVNVSNNETIASSKSAFGILLIGLVVVFGLNLFKNFDRQKGSLQFFGTQLQIGEGQENENGSEKTKEELGDDD
jgi:cytochrome b